MIGYFKPFEKKATCSLGCKNHILSDTTSELLSFKLTKSANDNEAKLLIPLTKTLKQHLKVFPQALVADAGCDYETNSKFIIQKLKAKPIIVRNLCWEKDREHKLSRKGTPICIARLEMISWGASVIEKEPG